MMKTNDRPLADNERLDTVNEQVRLIQNRNGLTFGTDAYLLAAFIRPAPYAHAVDLGSGTGAIPLLLLAKNKVRSVTAVEVQPTFVDLIERNAALNQVGDRLRPICADVRHLKVEDVGGESELVFSNPPYMKVNAGKRNRADEKYIARHEVCGDIFAFCACADRLLKYGGKFVCVWRPDRLTDLCNALQRSHLEPKRMCFVHADTAREPCSVLVEAVKGAAPALRIAPPLFLYQPQVHPTDRRILTDAAQKIYATCSFSDVSD